MSQPVTTVRLWIEIVFASVVGSGELVLMKLSDTNPSVGIYEFVYPLAVGFLMGIFGRGPVWILGPVTMLCMPVGMVVSMVTGSGGLNLWPIALIFYGVLALIGFVGAVIGRGAQRFWIKWSARNDA
jgi:hypothetical protein